MWCLPGFLWGAFLGRGLALTGQSWSEGKIRQARNICRDYGAISFMVQFGWVVCLLPWLLYDGWLFPYLIANTCFQAACLITLGGMLMPRKASDLVQISETIRI